MILKFMFHVCSYFLFRCSDHSLLVKIHNLDESLLPLFYWEKKTNKKLKYSTIDYIPTALRRLLNTNFKVIYDAKPHKSQITLILATKRNHKKKNKENAKLP